MSAIFISYRRADSGGHSGRLRDHVVRYVPEDDVFMDTEGIPPGADFVEMLDKEVTSCAVFLAVIGPSWAADDGGTRRIDQEQDFVRTEVRLAIQHGKHIIPVLVGGAKMPTAAQLPDDIAALARRNAVEIRDRHFASDVAQLVEAIFTQFPHLHRIDSAPTPAKAASKREQIRQKEAALKDVRDDLVSAVNSPLYAYRTANKYIPILGEGSATAKIMFIGESPSKTDAEQGRLFVGASGGVLDEMLRGISMKRTDVYMTNVLHDRPPDNRDPTPKELAFYEPFLDRVIDIIRPQVIATLGRFAMSYLLRKLDVPEKTRKITEIHGKLIAARMPWGSIHVLPLFHPALVLYNPEQKEDLRRDFELLKPYM
jgi:DNA polymerase